MPVTVGAASSTRIAWLLPTTIDHSLPSFAAPLPPTLRSKLDIGSKSHECEDAGLGIPRRDRLPLWGVQRSVPLQRPTRQVRLGCGLKSAVGSYCTPFPVSLCRFYLPP